MIRLPEGIRSSLRRWGFYAVLALGTFALTRVSLAIYALVFSGQGALSLLQGLTIGLVRDLLVAGLLALPWLMFESLPAKRWLHMARPALLFVYVFSLLFVAVSEMVFWDEFSTRFNFIAVDYLVYTNEVIGNIRESYPVGWMLAGMAFAAVALTHYALSKLPERTSHRHGMGWVLSLMGILFGVFLILLSALGAPEISANSYVNELADNGWRSFVSAARQNRLDYRQFYATRSDSEVLARLKDLSGKREIFATSAAAVRPVNMAVGKPPNVVVIMMESMSAEYMAHFGNTQEITPNLDALAEKGLLFSRLYSTGTRTVRGLEALSAALPPQPGMSIVRWPDLSNLNTLGGVLATHGWQPRFIYGGYGAFDNMNAYFAAQGYQVTDRTMFRDGLVQFENIWGVADEHLFDQALIELDNDAKSGKRFFAHIMTTTNHRPFTYPDGRIDIPSPGKRAGGVKYADFAIGRFLEMARSRPWFDNTVFLIVADHCASSAGKPKIPVDRYHIPAIVYAPKLIAPRKVDTLASQIDLVPTLLAMLGLSGDDHFVGRDILAMPPAEGRALLSTYQNLGYLKGDVMTVLQPKRRIETFRISADGREAQPMATDPVLAEEAIAYFQGSALLMAQHGQDGGGAKVVRP